MSQFGKDRRFERFARLIDTPALKKLHESHVMIVGLGGVGSWCAEALVRSGVGKITIVDFDKVSANNFNRQMPALTSTLGKTKAESLGQRLRDIHPECELSIRQEHVNRFDLKPLFTSKVDFVVDAIDQLGNKCALISFCVRHNIPLVTSAGAGGRLDPTRIRVIDLSQTIDDTLARMVRVYLRKRHLFPRKGLFHVPCVVSEEAIRLPVEPDYTGLLDTTPEAFQTVDPASSSKRNVVMGTACFVTSVFGMTCASVAIRTLIGERIPGIKNRPKSYKLPPEPELIPMEGGKNHADE
jgi:tRNA A37 threonylcarbamoyladenosine dehydratase